MTHRFHPLFGRDFEFVAHRQNWGEDRVHLHDEDGELFSLPAGWTDVAPADPVPLENRIRLVTCESSGCQAAREYSLIRPPRTGFRRIRSRSRSATLR